MTYYYNVADHVFSVELPEGCTILDEMGQYNPFSTNESAQMVFSLRVVDKEHFPQCDDITTEMNQDDDGSQILAGSLHGQPYFEFQLWGRCAARMITDNHYQHADVLLVDEPLFGINNALMVMYALSTANLQTALFHSSVVSCAGYGYMFLGKSGTGKSTHSSLWLKHISGTELVNDDNPVVRRMSDGFYVFGSPWSGKTPCYRNIMAPLGAVVQIARAPQNSIERLNTVEAFATLLPACSSMKWDTTIYNSLCDTLTRIIGTMPIYTLHCLPDEEAARLCHGTITVKQ